MEDNGGTAGGAIDLDPLPKTIRFTIPDSTAVNHAPSGTDFGIQIIEDSYLNFDPSFFGFSDAGDLPPNNFLAVKITTLPALGSLTLAGVEVTAGQTVTVASLRSSLLRWTPPPNVYASNYTNFTFQVQDDGGTANGGADLDPTPNIMRISVLASNDPPSGADRTIAVGQNATYIFTTADFPFSDPNDTPPNSLLAVKVATLPASGQLTYNNLPVTVGQLIPASGLVSGAFRFATAAGARARRMRHSRSSFRTTAGWSTRDGTSIPRRTRSRSTSAATAAARRIMRRAARTRRSPLARNRLTSSHPLILALATRPIRRPTISRR